MNALDFRSRHFPRLQEQVYLASCSLGAPSVPVHAALERMFGDMAGGEAWQSFEAEVEALRENVARLLGAHKDQIALLPNATVGAYQAISGIDLSQRNLILYSDQDFPSITHVWLAQGPRGAVALPVDSKGTHDDVILEYAASLTEQTAFVSVPLACYRHGQTLPVAQIGEAARSVGAKVFVDAYQALGVVPIDVESLGCDYLVGGTSKYLMGLPGIAFLYARDPGPNEVPPQLTGWLGRKRPFDFDAHTLDFPAEAKRFEIGTPAIPSVYAANAALKMLLEVPQESVNAHVSNLIRYASDQLISQGESLAHVPRPGEHGAHIAVSDTLATDLSSSLKTKGICCSPRGNVVRISVHYYNTVADIDACCRAMSSYRQSFR